EARLRVARDRHLSAQSGGTGTGGRLGAGFSTQPWGVPGTARGLSGSGAAGVRDGDGGPWNAEGEPMIVVTGTLRIDETAFSADSVTGTEDGESEPPQAETQTGARTQRAQRT